MLWIRTGAFNLKLIYFIVFVINVSCVHIQFQINPAAHHTVVSLSSFLIWWKPDPSVSYLHLYKQQYAVVWYIDYSVSCTVHETMSMSHTVHHNQVIILFNPMIWRRHMQICKVKWLFGSLKNQNDEANMNIEMRKKIHLSWTFEKIEHYSQYSMLVCVEYMEANTLCPWPHHIVTYNSP